MPELNCTANAAIAYNFLIGKGLTNVQAAAVVGNLQVESYAEMNPRLEVVDTDKALHRGIAMWSPLRWAELVKFADGRDPWVLETQLEFLWHELETQPSLGLDLLRSSTSIDVATRAFQDKFENPNPAKAATAKRIENANRALALYPLCPIVNPPPEPPKKIGAIAAAIGASVLFVAATVGAYKLFSRRPEPEPLPRYEPIYRPRPIPPPAFRRIP